MDKSKIDKKYELTEETKEVDGRLLYRIKSLKDFADVKKGYFGGWIESEHNLSHYGNCWIDDDAMVYGNAKVYGDAHVFGNSKVFNNAQVFGYAKVFGDAHICDDDKVFGNDKIFGDPSRVYDKAKIFRYLDGILNHEKV